MIRSLDTRNGEPGFADSDVRIAATLSFLGPLVGSLSLLLASLVPVVNNLLALVAALLDGILGGLSLALAGLVL